MNGNSTVIPRESFEGIQRLFHGNTARILLESNGYPTRILQESYENPTGIKLEFMCITKGIPRVLHGQSTGKSRVIPWEIHGYSFNIQHKWYFISVKFSVESRSAGCPQPGFPRTFTKPGFSMVPAVMLLMSSFI